MCGVIIVLQSQMFEQLGHRNAEVKIFQKPFFSFQVQRHRTNPTADSKEFHDYNVQKETEGIPTKLASSESTTIKKISKFMIVCLNDSLKWTFICQFFSERADRAWSKSIIYFMKYM